MNHDYTFSIFISSASWKDSAWLFPAFLLIWYQPLIQSILIRFMPHLLLTSSYRILFVTALLISIFFLRISSQVSALLSPTEKPWARQKNLVTRRLKSKSDLRETPKRPPLLPRNQPSEWNPRGMKVLDIKIMRIVSSFRTLYRSQGVFTKLNSKIIMIFSEIEELDDVDAQSFDSRGSISTISGSCFNGYTGKNAIKIPESLPPIPYYPPSLPPPPSPARVRFKLINSRHLKAMKSFGSTQNKQRLSGCCPCFNVAISEGFGGCATAGLASAGKYGMSFTGGSRRNESRDIWYTLASVYKKIKIEKSFLFAGVRCLIVLGLSCSINSILKNKRLSSQMLDPPPLFSRKSQRLRIGLMLMLGLYVVVSMRLNLSESDFCCGYFPSLPFALSGKCFHDASICYEWRRIYLMSKMCDNSDNVPTLWVGFKLRGQLDIWYTTIGI